jgi:hypothetical protein
MRLTEESNMHKSLNNKTKQDFDKSVESFKKTIGTSLDCLYRTTNFWKLHLVLIDYCM